MIIFGLHLTRIFKIKALYTDARLRWRQRGAARRLGAFVIGLRLLWLDVVPGTDSHRHPDAGQRAGHSGEGSHPVGRLFAWAGGAISAYLALLMERFLKFYSRFRSHMHALEVASGGLLIALGILLVIGRFTLISSWLSFLNRFAL